MGNQQEKELTTPYAFGSFLGDGTAAAVPTKDKRDGNIYMKRWIRIVGIDEDVIDEFLKEVNAFFDKDYQSWNISNNLWAGNCQCKPIYEYFTENTGFKNYLPETIWTSSKQTVLRFMAGLLDTDGWIANNPQKKNGKIYNRFSMGLTSTFNWLFRIRELLNKFEIKANAPIPKKRYGEFKNMKPCYNMSINLKSFVEAGGHFVCRRKQQKLEDYKHKVLAPIILDPQRLHAEPLNAG